MLSVSVTKDRRSTIDYGNCYVVEARRELKAYLNSLKEQFAAIDRMKALTKEEKVNVLLHNELFHHLAYYGDFKVKLDRRFFFMSVCSSILRQQQFFCAAARH